MKILLKNPGFGCEWIFVFLHLPNIMILFFLNVFSRNPTGLVTGSGYYLWNLCKPLLSRFAVPQFVYFKSNVGEKIELIPIFSKSYLISL